ncbi:MAG TPA: hypothetical protein VK668_03715 [Mucilaginibacter sp.]|nr:hypothetical protein [Mucilaginibacter sp.]
MENLSKKELLEVWYDIGCKNSWISGAVDPPFQRQSLCKCDTLETLKSYLKSGNWCLGQGFYFQNLCFINQMNGGDEWLTIKDDYAFESITFEGIILRGEFEDLISRLLRATREQCINLEY